MSHRVDRLAPAVMVASLLLAVVPVLAARAAPASAQARAPIMPMKTDLATRSPDIHWPEGFDPKTADLFSHNQLFVNASCERVFDHIVDANKWPSWYPNSRDVVIQGGGDKLKDGAVFRWTTFGLPLESRIHEFVPNERVGWYGYAPGQAPSFYHTWYLVPGDGGCMVVMDEVGKGKDAAHLREIDEGLMHRGHDLWLATLKWVAEGKQ